MASFFDTQAADLYTWREEVGLLLSLRSESVSTCGVPLLYQSRWHVGIQKKTIFRLLPVRKSMTQIPRVGGSWRKNIRVFFLLMRWGRLQKLEL